MLLLGIDLGTSSIKVSVVDSGTQRCIASARHPEQEVAIRSLQTGWAEQSPEMWWHNIKGAIQKLIATQTFHAEDIRAIGIAYQMHGLVVVDRDQRVLRDSIIWCDSRAVGIGNEAYEHIGGQCCRDYLLNSPGNFTASKLGWVKRYEPELYDKIDKIMLPGDFAAMKMTGEISTTRSALSEGIFWDFKNSAVSTDVMRYFNFSMDILPPVRDVFCSHGTLLPEVASELGLTPGIPVSYKAGDQLNNAVSLKVFEPGEVAATAGTSGVIYAVTDKLFSDEHSRVNAFAHVNHAAGHTRLGVLLCINGAGIMNRWTQQLTGATYPEMNARASKVDPGSDGLMIFPFGNGAERMLENKIAGAHISEIDLNKHSPAHLFRAVQEGIVYSFRYGLDIMRENGIEPTIIRAGRANMFLSDLFVDTFVNVTNVAVELYKNDGSIGAALGAGIGAGIYSSAADAFVNLKPERQIAPNESVKLFSALYNKWRYELHKFI